jgi:beta-galactosidase GanA
MQNPLTAAFLVATLVATLPAAASETVALPHLVQKDGRHALFVDGAPFLLLGVQAGNSSDWPAMLPKVWPAVEFVHANTLEIPIYWEQFEPRPGVYDPSMVDTLIKQAREHHVRLVLLWFGTWKNGSAHYMPLWMKRDAENFPKVIGKTGRRVDSPSPHASAPLEADTRAFRALMRHLKAVDHDRTVIMVQVENEPGTWNSVRDYSPAAEKLFAAPVPAELLRALGKSAPAGANWAAVFGSDADEYFHAWSVAHFIGQVAAAGKAEYLLPLYVNAALRDPLGNPPAHTYESGGPTDNVLAIWKAAAPAIDLLAPDIYLNDGPRYQKVLELYSRPDNPLFVPETSSAANLAKYCFAALGRGAIGWAPFGVDYTNYAAAPIGAPWLAEEKLTQLALNFRLLGPMMREVARLNFEGRLQAAVEERDAPGSTLAFGKWRASVGYGVPGWGFGKEPKGNPEPVGRVLVAQTGENEFLVAGYFCRVDFQLSDPASGGQREYLHVEEGSYENGVFQPVRIWNGDQTDWGLNFSSVPQILRVQLGTY